MLFTASVLAAIAFWAHAFLFIKYAHKGCPKIAPPNCEIQINNHGAISYISRHDAVVLEALVLSFGILFVAAAVLFVYDRKIAGKGVWRERGE